MKKIFFGFFGIFLLLLAGCGSSGDPVITNYEIVNLKYDAQKERIDYKLKVKYAIDENLENPINGIMKVSFDEGDYTKELEWGFFPGQRNADISFGLGYSDYPIGHIVKGNIEMIRGTEIIDTKRFEVVYND